MLEVKYRPDVDGLRAVAVGLVLLFHAGLGFPGGFVGVDVFFVISGFLITGLILREQETGTFSLANFWLRRIRRIIPPATVMVFAVVVAGYFLLLPDDYADLGKSVVAQQLMLSNFYFWKSTGYFDGPAELKPLLHTWSLAVEEQFYLGYPLLLATLNHFRRASAGTILAILGLISLVASQYGVEYHRSAAFFLLPTRAWELLAGGLICFVPAPTRIHVRLLNYLSWLSLAAILYAGCVFTATTPFPGRTALLPCGGAALLIYANSRKPTFPAAILASKPMVFLGLLSYPLYLWHWPILAFLRYRLGANLDAGQGVLLIPGVAIASSLGLAWLSWKFVETPIRLKRVLGSPRRLVFASGFGFAVACTAGIFMSRDGCQSRFSPEFLAIIDVPYAGHGAGATGNASTGWVLRPIGSNADDRLPPRFVLWGDSSAKCVSRLCDEIARQSGVAGYDAGKAGTPPLFGVWTRTESQADTIAYNEFVFGEARRQRIKWLLLVAAWDVHAQGMSGLTDRAGGDSSTVMSRSLEDTIARAEAHGMHVAVLLQCPYQWHNVPPRVARDCVAGPARVSYGVSQTRHDEFQARTRRLFEGFGSRVRILDAREHYFDQSGRSIIGRDCVPYYSDADHLSREGVRAFLEQPLRALFAEISSDASSSSDSAP